MKNPLNVSAKRHRVVNVTHKLFLAIIKWSLQSIFLKSWIDEAGYLVQKGEVACISNEKLHQSMFGLASARLPLGCEVTRLSYKS